MFTVACIPEISVDYGFVVGDEIVSVLLYRL